MIAFDCAECGTPSGTSLICRECIPKLSTHKRQKYRAAWHKVIVTAANCTCEECGHSAPFDSGELCGDHIKTKGSRPDLEFDVMNGKSTCLPCHNGRHAHGLKKPEAEKKPKFNKPGICSVSACPIYALGEGKKPKNCWKHQ